MKTQAKKNGGDYQLSGKKRWVLDGHAADHIVVSARTSGGDRDRDGVSLFVVDPGMPGLEIQRVDCMDGHKAALVNLDGVIVGKDRLLGEEGKAAAVLEHAMDYGAAAACCGGLRQHADRAHDDAQLPHRAQAVRRCHRHVPGACSTAR